MGRLRRGDVIPVASISPLGVDRSHGVTLIVDHETFQQHSRRRTIVAGPASSGPTGFGILVEGGAASITNSGTINAKGSAYGIGLF
jgi:hypothetical protein